MHAIVQHSDPDIRVNLIEILKPTSITLEGIYTDSIEATTMTIETDPDILIFEGWSRPYDGDDTPKGAKSVAAVSKAEQKNLIEDVTTIAILPIISCERNKAFVKAGLDFAMRSDSPAQHVYLNIEDATHSDIDYPEPDTPDYPGISLDS